MWDSVTNLQKGISHQLLATDLYYHRVRNTSVYGTTILSLFSCFGTMSFVADECSNTELLDHRSIVPYLYNRALVDDDVFDDEVRYR